MREGTAILIPAMRPDKLHALIRNIEATTPEPYETWIICTMEVETILAGFDGHYRVIFDEGDTWGHRLNYAYEKIGGYFDYVFCGADDLLFHEGWLPAAIKAQEGVDGVVMVSDLCSDNGTLPFVSVNYLETEGGTVDGTGAIIHEGYHHNFSERELVETAMARGRYAYCAESVVEHLHWMAGKADRSDPVYQLGESRWNDDIALFSSRQPIWTNPR